MIGIIGAMEEEVAQLKKQLSEKEEIIISGLKFIKGKYKVNNKNYDMVVVRCGVGKVNAAMCTEALINKFNPQYIMNVGVAGGINNRVNIGDIVISTSLFEHDFDVTAFGYKKGEIPRLKSSEFKADERLLKVSDKAIEDFKKINKNINFFKGVIVSGDIFVNSKEIKEELQERYNAYAAEMEGASIAHVCVLNNVPFLVIRSMSDKADGSAAENFDEFEIHAAENGKIFIEKIMENMED